MRHLKIIFLVFTLVSCSTSTMLQSGLSKYNSSVDYLHDRPAMNCNKGKLVYVTFNNFPLDSVTTVKKMKSTFIPLIFFNYFETVQKVKLGQHSIKENYNTFFENSILEESKRSGCFRAINFSPVDSAYVLDISIDTCNTTSVYKKTAMVLYFLIAGSYGFSESCSPATTSLYVTAKLRKGNDQLFDKKYAVTKFQPFVKSRLQNSQALLSSLTTNMVEVLSMSTKDCIEQIVDDVNQTLYGSQLPISSPDIDTNSKQTVPPTANSVTDSQNVAESDSLKTGNNRTDSQLKVGDVVRFYSPRYNAYLKGTVKSLNGRTKTVLVEYVSFDIVKTVELSVFDVKKINKEQ